MGMGAGMEAWKSLRFEKEEAHNLLLQAIVENSTGCSIVVGVAGLIYVKNRL
jgi:exosome complex RNA-binding protein Rrp4